LIVPAWLLPDNFSDILPDEAARLEVLRRRLLDLFSGYGYALVQPPLLEHVESLLTHESGDLDLRTFKVVDQVSGRLLGIRADITPQIARIDAHQSHAEGVNRLCYAGSVVHTQPAGLLSSREPVQLGCELFGHAGLEADLEVQELALAALDAAGIQKVRLDLSHRGVYLALREQDPALAPIEDDVLAALQSKDRVGLTRLIQSLAPATQSALIALLDLYGPCAGADNVIQKARKVLPGLPAITQALDRLQAVADSAMFVEHPACVLTVDLADLRGYRYHNGVMFSIYCAGLPNAVVRGGRYDGVGAAFGRARPATGFSLELRELLEISAASADAAVVQRDAVAAPWRDDRALRLAIAKLRAEGRVVVQLPQAELSAWTGQQLINEANTWMVK
jgi:ATP phosphoribosyltransferase regulatory subunit